MKLLTQDTKSEMNRTVEDFTANIKALAEELKTKHLKQKGNLLKKLKSTQPKGIVYKLDENITGESTS